MAPRSAVVGIEARPVKSDTGDHWLSASTLHPEGSRKVAKAINAASGNRPVVVLASLSGFDGSARSMKGRQLEFGAEIARAVTNFDGPIVVVVLGRFHGGAYVVFSKALNPNVKILALDGAFVSVIGGDAAAGVVFAGELKKREAAAMAEDPTQDPVPCTVASEPPWRGSSTRCTTYTGRPRSARSTRSSTSPRSGPPSPG